MPELIIDPRFVDVDLKAEAKRLGFMPGDLHGQSHFTDAKKGLFADYADEFPILPEAERTAAIQRLDAEGGIENLVRWILNQGNEGSCVGNAWTQGVQVLLAKKLGEANAVPLSAISAYKQIGSSANSGANIDDALDCGERIGVLPLDTPENRARFGALVMPATGFRTPYPANWQSVAKQFRIKKRFIIRSIAAMEQAGINGHPIVVGRAGHSILYLRPSLRSGRGQLYVNSWGQWGFGAGGHSAGFGFDTGRLVSSSAAYCWAFVDITSPDYALAA